MTVALSPSSSRQVTLPWRRNLRLWTHTPAAGEVGKYRLDQYITDHLPGAIVLGYPARADPRSLPFASGLIGGMRTSKSAVQRSIKSGLATVNGVAVTKASASVRAGDRISYREFKPEPQTCAPEPIELDIKYEDGDLIVVNKPAGMTVHPAKGLVSGTLVNALLHHVGAKAITLHADEDEDGAADGDADESDDEGVHQLSQMRIIQDTLPRGRRVHPEDCAVAAPHPKFALALTALHKCDTWAAPTNGRGLGAPVRGAMGGWVGGMGGLRRELRVVVCLL